MSSARFHLAQMNIARALAALDDPLMAEFVARLDSVNALAEASPGFVWRLKDESGNAISLQVFDDPLVIVNMSVWASIEALENYVYRSGHTEVLRARRKWFELPSSAHLALWWVPVGHVPTIAEGKARLTRIDRLGPTPEAFTFRSRFPAPSEQSLEPQPG